jgi:hypothetical protein
MPRIPPTYVAGGSRTLFVRKPVQDGVNRDATLTGSSSMFTDGSSAHGRATASAIPCEYWDRGPSEVDATAGVELNPGVDDEPHQAAKTA